MGGCSFLADQFHYLQLDFAGSTGKNVRTICIKWAKATLCHIDYDSNKKITKRVYVIMFWSSHPNYDDPFS
jgi:hypothetical protein